jgi:hypothetical protein
LKRTSGSSLSRAERHIIQPVRDLVEHILLGVQAVTRLVDVAELDRLADLEAACVRRFLAGDQAKERRFARAVGPITPTMPPFGSENSRFSNSTVSP